MMAIPEGYDEIAAPDPEAAFRIVKTRDGPHEVVKAINEPPERNESRWFTDGILPGVSFMTS